MPYIPTQLKKELKQRPPLRPGELTFSLYRLCKEYLGENFRYDDIAAVLGSLEATKLEVYRRIVSPYEDQKIVENGDV